MDHQTCNYGLDPAKCKERCSEDLMCKGYYGQTKQHCGLATTSPCGPLSTGQTSIGNDGELVYNPQPPCSTEDFTPCFIKQGSH